jgi:hypothetical protein
MSEPGPAVFLRPALYSAGVALSSNSIGPLSSSIWMRPSRRLAVHEAKALIEAQSAPPPDAQRKSLYDRGEAPSEFLRNLRADRL